MKLCVIGDPVRHSRSPAIHAALMEQAGIAGTYEAVTVCTGELAAFVERARAGDYDGFNVTMPHKEAIIPLLDGLAPSAAAIGAVNTVVVRHGQAIGCNTDGEGFIRSLPFTPKRALVLGNGGAAKAVCYALRQHSVETVVCCRHPRKDELPWEKLHQAVQDTELLINATPLGMTGKPDFSDIRFLQQLPAGAVVYDLIYEPQKTALLRQAEELGYPVIGGLALLHSQAKLAFDLFTGADI